MNINLDKISGHDWSGKKFKIFHSQSVANQCVMKAIIKE